MKGLLAIFVITAVLGFVAAAIIYKVLRSVLRFRAEWNLTFIACMMTMFVCEFTLFTAFSLFDSDPAWYLLKVTVMTALVSLIAGTAACRLIIRSESGRHLPTLGALFLAFVLTAPPTLLGLAMHVLSN